MKILFITATRLGDCVLSMGALDHLVKKYPAAEITVACGPLAAGLFSPVPTVTKVLALKKQPYAGHWLKLAGETLWQKWDIVVDLRNSLFSRFLLAGKKYIWSDGRKDLHRVAQIGALIEAAPPPAPRLWFDAESLALADRLTPAGPPILAIGPVAAAPVKTWPQENFVALIQKLTAADGILPGARVAVLAAPGEESKTNLVLEAIPENRRIDLVGKLPPLAAAAVIRKATLYIGNDSGLMHMAAAVGTPTLGLFGPGWPAIYGPWGENTAHISTPESAEELFAARRAGKIDSTLMSSLTVDAVHTAANTLWNKAKEKARV